MNSLIEKEINTCNAERNCIYDELEMDKIRFATQIQLLLGEIEQNLRCQENVKKDRRFARQVKLRRFKEKIKNIFLN